MTDVWSPIKLGNLQLPHRLAMAPMTRSRAKPDGTPGDLAPAYYAQRATDCAPPSRCSRRSWRTASSRRSKRNCDGR
jgi:hypothetical protein